MVASHFSEGTGNTLQKAFEKQVVIPVGPPDNLPLDHVELDFSDVFGPVPVQAPLEFSCEGPKTFALDANDLVYDDPAVIYSCSRSLVGPTTYVSQSSKLSKLALHETEDLELMEGVSGGAFEELMESSLGHAVSEESILQVVGQGSFARVYQVRKRGSCEIFAMKVMRKDKVMEKNHAEDTKAERDILTKVDHPFIVQLRYSFQTKYRLYLVLDFVNGGHLFFQLYRQGLFREDLARLYTAEIVSAVSHLHANGIMHRDLKPENILLDAEGH
ncbi:hypothetical protein RJ639_009941, partial [Escallonia herrerae]